MKKFEYQAVILKINTWTRKPKEDILDVINEYGEIGWRFVSVLPHLGKTSKPKEIELIFEKEITI